MGQGTDIRDARGGMMIRTLGEIDDELISARSAYPKMHSPHHALGVLDEEVFELRLEIYKKPMDRDREKLRREAVQVAATAIRIIEEL